MNPTILKHALKTALVMIAFTIVSTLGLAVIYHSTKAPISKAEAEVRMRLFGQILPTDLYDNDLLQDAIKQPAGGDLGNRDETMIHRARVNSEPAAVILEATAPDGYSGDIKLLVAIKSTGEIVGVRVLDHKETPGLGDYIDIKKDRWITQFDDESLTKTVEKLWRVKKDNGQFDYKAGATITPRAVVGAVHKALLYFEKNKLILFNQISK